MKKNSASHAALGRIAAQTLLSCTTPVGRLRGQWHEFEGVPMPYFLRFSGAYGLHAGRLPGYPASSGCIRLPKRQAKRFYDAVRIGTPVIVQR